MLLAFGKRTDSEPSGRLRWRTAPMHRGSEPFSEREGLGKATLVAWSIWHLDDAAAWRHSGGFNLDTSGCMSREYDDLPHWIEVVLVQDC